MKNIFQFFKNSKFILLALMSFVGISNAQQFGAYHMGDKVFQNSNISPLFLNENAVNFGLSPSIQTVNNFGLNLNEVLKKDENNKNKLGIIWKGIADNSGKTNRLISDVTLGIMGVSWKYGKNMYSVQYNIRSTVGMKYDEGMASIIGNGIDKTTSFNLEGYSNVYSEIALGYKRKIKKFSVGVRLKYLNGVGYFGIKGGGTLDIHPDSYVWTVSNNAGSGVDISHMEKLRENGYVNFGENHGGAVDIGVDFTLNDKLSFALSATDIGFISWVENPANHQLTKVTNKFYRGVDLEKERMTDLEKTIQELFGYDKSNKTNNTFVRWLPINGYASARYEWKKNHIVSAVIHYQHLLQDANFSLGYNYQLKKFGAGLHTSYYAASRDVNLGGSIYFQMDDEVQFYLVAENLLKIYNLNSVSKLNFAIGLNIVLQENRRATKDAIFNEELPIKNVEETDTDTPTKTNK